MTVTSGISAAEYRAQASALKAVTKYRNRKTAVNGVTFDSKLEADRYKHLRWREMAGEISELDCQVPFALTIEGVLVGSYKADFVYYDNVRKQRVVEDCKSKATVTDLFRLKSRLMWAIHRIAVEIVERAEYSADARAAMERQP